MKSYFLPNLFSRRSSGKLSREGVTVTASILSFLVLLSAAVLCYYKFTYFENYYGTGRLKAGMEAPHFKLKNPDGKEVSLSDFSNQKAVLLNFFATWCGPCRVELPYLAEFAGRYKKDGLVLVGINVEEDKEAIAAYMKREKFKFTVLLDSDGEVSDLYGVSAIPRTFVIDPAGYIRHVHVGQRLPGKEFFDEISRLLGVEVKNPSEETAAGEEIENAEARV